MEENSNTLIRKFFQGITIFFLFFGMVFYASENYIKWKIRPEITINTDSIPSHSVPFPAVTICSPLIIKSGFTNLSKYYTGFSKNENISLEVRSLVEASYQVCKDSLNWLRNPFIDSDSFDQNTVKILNETSPSFEDTFLICILGLFDGCEELFIRTLTDDGYCFTYNLVGYHSIFKDNISTDFDSYKRTKILKSWEQFIDREYHNDFVEPETSKWSLDSGYTDDDKFVQPQKAIRTKLEIRMMMENMELKNFCELRRNTYKIILHPPNELPTMFHTENFLELKYSKEISITAEPVTTDVSLKDFKPENRGCYFENERSLRFFRSYTQINCEYECMINFTMTKCNCVKFSMPRSENTTICNDKDLDCYEELIDGWPESYWRGQDTGDRSKFPCDCIQSCNQINYKVMQERSFEINEESAWIWNHFQDKQVILGLVDLFNEFIAMELKTKTTPNDYNSHIFLNLIFIFALCTTCEYIKIDIVNQGMETLLISEYSLLHY